MDGREGRQRVVLTGVSPELDCGRVPIKRTIGETVVVEADIFADGHDELAAVLRSRHEEEPVWAETPLEPVGHDRWRGSFPVTALGRYRYTLLAWVDRFKTWRRDLVKRAAAGQALAIELQVGARLLEEAARRAADGGDGDGAERLRGWAEALGAGPGSEAAGLRLAVSEELGALMARHADRRFATAYEKELEVIVDREQARFSAWYELFPRSCAATPGRHGTFRDCEARLPYVAAMGFDVLYLPPIHPIGRTERRGPNNRPGAGPEDPGSPWAIGSEAGGHQAVHPALGTLEDFRRLVAQARRHGLEIALDLAFQCSPDHPYVKEHPEWFCHRPDGTVRYAENPPKRYQDIYPLDFECEAWRALWEELRDVVRFWIEQGVRLFRVDNPHTKPLRFWEWLIAEITREHPDVLFLSEAFTRPKVQHHLAKVSFNQSYTYFAWRNTKRELIEYFTELTQSEAREYFRPNLWPNTPDILTEYLQVGGRPAFMVRLILAATLGASYGIYGPAFELCEARARESGSEEYLDSEKYQIRQWDLERPDSLRELIARVNRIRRENPALQQDRSLRFHPSENEAILAYSKRTEDLANVIVVLVNLDPHHRQGGWVELPLRELGLDEREPYLMEDLLSGTRVLWSASRNYVELVPGSLPAHIFCLRRRLRTERAFEYFL